MFSLRRAGRRRSWVLGCTFLGGMVAVVLGWMHVTATQDLVAYLQKAPPCRITWSARGPQDSLRTWKVTLHDARGGIEATLRLPPGDAQCAAVVILGGLRTGRHAVDLVPRDVPYAVAALDYGRSDTERIEGLGWLAELPGLLRDLRRTGVALRDLRRAVAALDRVDPSRVYLLGASLGTPLACAVTAAEPPAGLALLYGFADHAAIFAHRLERYLAWDPGRRLLASLAGWLSGAFDPARTLPRACGVPTLVIGSEEDEEMPRRCSRALWNALCEPKQRVNLPGGHIDSGRKQELLRAATEAVRDWLEEGPSASVGGTDPRSFSVRFLLTNDDGIRASGLAALERTLDGLGEIRVVAPDRERSGAGHSLTLDHPLRVASLDETHHAVSGTPTDAVLLAVEKLLPEKPDWVISGINHGPNMGEDVTYSGTVAAAIEATILGIPAMAVSLTGRESFQFDSIRPLLRQLLQDLMRFRLDRNQLLNVNVPNVAAERIRGVRVTRLGSRVYRDTVVEQRDPRGRSYYWIGGTGPEWADDPQSDASAVKQEYISVTPLRLDMTDYRAIVEMEAFVATWPSPPQRA